MFNFKRDKNRGDQPEVKEVRKKNPKYIILLDLYMLSKETVEENSLDFIKDLSEIFDISPIQAEQIFYLSYLGRKPELFQGNVEQINEVSSLLIDSNIPFTIKEK